jgi:Tfp pilus assembly protein PilO
MVKDRFLRQLLINIGIILASIIVAAGIIFFLSGTIATQVSMIQKDRTLVQQNTDAIANLAQLESDAPQAARYQAAINELLPNQYGLLTFAQWLSQLGAQYGVTANAAFQGAVVPRAGTTAGTAQFSFNAEGSPANMATFLDALNVQSTGFLVSLTSFDVTSDGVNEKIVGQGTLFFQ